ncbi:hypothetical protein P7K49_019145 [Saguinus oedipus]|uniref:Anoctamin n=1 Tax=Saguinus oedipus TaxID=9490 RepID=A0ABQ9UWK1_SAGOE|nr:hypothetical protein P7K49_019145 [Saguinus oedipus]
MGDDALQLTGQSGRDLAVSKSLSTETLLIMLPERKCDLESVVHCDPESVVWCDLEGEVQCDLESVVWCNLERVVQCDLESVALCELESLVWCELEIVVLCGLEGVVLCDLEEVPKTEQSFEERLILKAFLLKFVNAYSPIFYVAFFKGRFVGRPGSYVYVFDGYRMEEASTATDSLVIYCSTNLPIAFSMGKPCLPI